MTLFRRGFFILYIPSFPSYLHRNKRLLARGNKDDERGGEGKAEEMGEGRRAEGAGDGRVHGRVSLTIASIVYRLLNYLLSLINVQETRGRAPAADSRRLA